MNTSEDTTEDSEYIDQVHDRIHDIIDRLWMHYDDTDVEALVEAMERKTCDNDYVGDE